MCQRLDMQNTQKIYVVTEYAKVLYVATIIHLLSELAPTPAPALRTNVKLNTINKGAINRIEIRNRPLNYV